eukprot:CAMPEP_0114589398 /NCGR_PEP_ID=MMETSP0125-20121206/11849_1 /TAXON_ID=485358 ORGANISM="Aristerostoma sp., Strain ATCC 50986" /NCGR_SAMPLE_ID=MMETSP0125 /ASSEMBLY_ACC=CAM_ASM_000245 /LENGTH=244 /DNA_ID=CAMNT_0001786251 /DNA_START=56 /DNA_END=790 /DNA_ORIENTATION=+
MSFFKKSVKWGLFFGTLGTAAYFNRHFYFGAVHKKHTFDENDLSDHFQKYIKENDLVMPYHYQNYQKMYTLDHFFEKSILKDINGLNEYNIFLDRYYHDVITDNVVVSDEKRQELHDKAKIHCVFIPNSMLQGHVGIVHGGFLSTLLDNVSGALSFVVSDFSPCVTAYLNMNFRKPVQSGKEYIATIEVAKREGKKLFLKGKVFDKEGVVHCEMDSLFIKAKINNYYMGKIMKSILLEKKIHDY